MDRKIHGSCSGQIIGHSSLVLRWSPRHTDIQNATFWPTSTINSTRRVMYIRSTLYNLLTATRSPPGKQQCWLDSNRKFVTEKFDQNNVGYKTMQIGPFSNNLRMLLLNRDLETPKNDLSGHDVALMPIRKTPEMLGRNEEMFKSFAKCHLGFEGKWVSVRCGCFSGLEHLGSRVGCWFRHRSHPHRDHGLGRHRCRCYMEPLPDSKVRVRFGCQRTSRTHGLRNRLTRHWKGHGGFQQRRCGFG